MIQNESDPLMPSTVDAFANAGLQRDNLPAVEVGPDSPPWGVGGAVLTWLGSVLIMALVQVPMLLGYAYYRGIGFAAMSEFITQDRTALFVLALSLLPSHILTLGLVWLVVTRGGKLPFL